MFSDVDEDGLTARFGDAEIEQASARNGKADENAVCLALTDSKADAGAMLRRRFRFAALSTVPTPQSVQVAICDLARWRLYDEHPTEEIAKRAEQARSHLLDVATGLAEIYDENADILAAWDAADIQGGADSDDESISVASRKGTTRRFTEASLDDYTHGSQGRFSGLRGGRYS